MAQWDTPAILKAGRTALVVGAAALLAASLAGVRVHRAAMQTVGKDSAPSIIAAQHIKSALADMDADAANELLGAAGTQAAGDSAYEARREEAAKALIAAAENITYGAGERTPIQALQLGMGTFERLIQRARDLRERNDGTYLDAYREAARLMDTTLLPAAEALDKANNDVLERTYVEQADRSSAAMMFLLFAGLALVAALVWLQGFLSRRMRRTVNPFLLVATALALIALQYAFFALRTEERELKVAREDAFTSIHALWRARAVAYAANGDESRYLLDPAHAAESDRAFAAKADALAKLPAGSKWGDVASAERSGTHIQGFSGYLADELNNITFAGEREAAVQSVERFAEYVAVDKEIRRLEVAGKHREAIELCVGDKPGESDWAFERFDKAVEATLAINQQAFDAAVSSSFAALDGFEIKASALAAAIAALAFLGLAPRIKEYE